MQGEISQIISLTSYGNEFLINGTLIENYFPNNTTFQFCNLVDFKNFKKKWLSSKLEEIDYAQNPIDWFKNLQKDGCKKLRLYYKSLIDTSRPEYESVGFVGGGGTWLIESVFDGYSTYWHKRWQVTNQNAEDRKIWTVNYGQILENPLKTNQQLEADLVTCQLKDTFKHLIEFCDQQDFQSWVFGGMGSWNDMYFENKEINEPYLKLSQQLYDLLVKGIIAVINSY